MRGDSFARYCHEISRRPVIDPVTERTLVLRYAATGDPAAMRALAEGHLRLVVKLARAYHARGASLPDLVQEGNLGLLHAIRKFDPERGVKLSSYAALWIRAYILRHIMSSFATVRIGTSQRERKLFFGLRKVQRELGEDLGPLAARLEVSEREIEQMDQRLGGSEVSLDAAPAGYGHSLVERLASDAADPEEQASASERARLTASSIAALGPGLDAKDRCILERRMLSLEPLQLAEIGARFGITRERVRQRETMLRNRLRAHLATAA